MRDIDLFQLALGLVPPWMVADAKFDAEKKRLDIEIDFKTGGRFACPECGKADCPIHDTVKKNWRLPAPGLPARVSRPHCVHCCYGPVTRGLPKGGLVDGLQDLWGFWTPPPSCHPNYKAPDFCPGRFISC